MKLLCIFVAAAVAGGEKPKIPKLSGDAKEAFDSIKKSAADRMSDMYLDKLENYGKKDYTVNAAGVQKWMAKMEVEFRKKIAVCGADYWMADPADMEPVVRRRRAMDDAMDFSMDDVCNEFNGYTDALVEWTNTYMVECCFMTQKKNNSSQKCTKPGDKYVAKWKKIMRAFHHASRFQPNGALCADEWTPTWTDE